MTQERTVYIPNLGSHNFSGAMKYGKLIPLTRGRLNLFSVGILFRLIAAKLSVSHPNDFILVCGPTIASILACVVFALYHKRLNLLLFHVNSRGEGTYKRRDISFTLMEGVKEI